MNPPKAPFARETLIRDAYSSNLLTYRPLEKLIKCEVTYQTAAVRADMRTVDRTGLIREWEFKLIADYSALGQILTYLALARREYKFERQIRGVIAAFSIPPLVSQTIETLNLGIELILIPNHLRAAGGIPMLPIGVAPSNAGLFIPNTSHLISPQSI
jgi:hypothetical protein